MPQPLSTALPRAQRMAGRAFATLERFLHVEAFSGVVLLAAAAIALAWANSPFAASYHHLWHAEVAFSFGGWRIAQSLHFLINDVLMTVFFLVVGMEIRREIHQGALSRLKLAALPLSAAAGGVLVPALIYLALNHGGVQAHGWAVPTATDIAFAVGVLALLGRSVPVNVRIFLLALAIIDDIAAVLIIALFYSGGLDYNGVAVALVGILMVLGLKKIGVGSAYVYVLPGAVLWIGLLMTGAHPPLAGVVLGLMTPVIPTQTSERPLDVAAKAVRALWTRNKAPRVALHDMMEPLKQLRQAQRDLLSPVSRVQTALHPWVALGVMPIFALANAGVTLGGIDLSANGSAVVMLGMLLALVLGKPVGVISVSWLVVRLGLCALPPGVNWGGVCLVGLLAGIGFTMSIFIATLAFVDVNLLSAAKLGVLLASLCAAIFGLTLGCIQAKQRAASDPTPATRH